MRFLKDLDFLLASLRSRFSEATRQEQVRTIETICIMVTTGTATLLICLFYPFIPALIRLIAVPAILFGSYAVARFAVSPTLLNQFNYLDSFPKETKEALSTGTTPFLKWLKWRNLPGTSLTMISLCICACLFLSGIAFCLTR